MKYRIVWMTVPLLLAGIVTTAGILFPDSTYNACHWLRHDFRRWMLHWAFVAQEWGEPTPLPSPETIGKGAMLMMKKCAEPLPYLDQEGYAVLHAWMTSWNLNGAMVNRNATAITRDNMDILLRETPSEFNGAAEDLLLQNTMAWRFQRQSGPSTSYSLVEWNRQGTQEKPMLTFSVLGFSKDRTIAIFWATYSCGCRCARSSYEVMKKRDNLWVPVGSIRLQVS